jgi:hypothetical protein
VSRFSPLANKKANNVIALSLFETMAELDENWAEQLVAEVDYRFIFKKNLNFFFL